MVEEEPIEVFFNDEDADIDNPVQQPLPEVLFHDPVLMEVELLSTADKETQTKCKKEKPTLNFGEELRPFVNRLHSCALHDSIRRSCNHEVAFRHLRASPSSSSI